MLGLGLSLGMLMLMLLGAAVWVGLALMAAGLVSLELFREMAVTSFLAGDTWRSLTAPELAALPLFILMGEILFRSGLADRMFSGLAPWMRRIPGQLLHTNVVGCTLFAAVSGSSAATTATIGSMTLPELERRGYDRDLAMGSLCGAGTLGFLIPPSIILILYGVLANISIIDLFIAGILPGLILALGTMAYVAIRVSLKPSLAPQKAAPTGWRQKLRALGELGPVFMLILLVIGSMYMGYAGPTEAATVGVAGALLIAGLSRTLDRRGLAAALLGAIKTSSMIGLIVTGAFFLAKAIALFGLPQAIAEMIAGLHLSPYALIAILLVFYILLGMVMDGLSIIVMTLPIALPLVTAAGFGPLWFGIFIVIVVEMSQITPPVGFNLFIVQNLTGQPIGRIARASLPFFLIMTALIALITLFPAIVTWPVS